MRRRRFFTLSQTRLFGEAVSSVVEKFRSATSQSAALKQFMPRRMRDSSNTPSTSLSRERSLPRKEPTSRSCAPSGSCPHLQFQRMFGPLQARPSCLCEHLPQAPGPYGRSVPCAAYHSIQKILLRCFQHNTTNNKYFLSSKSDY